MEEAHALDAVILRPATVYGPRSTDVVGEIARAIRGGNMLLVDGGRAIAGLCYVDNLIDAAVLALRHEAAPGHAFNVSDGLDVTWKEFTDGLAAGPRLLARPMEPAVLAGERHRLLARARLPVAAQDHPSEHAASALATGRARDGHGTRTSAIARRESCSAGNRASTMRRGLEATLAWLRSLDRS